MVRAAEEWQKLQVSRTPCRSAQVPLGWFVRDGYPGAPCINPLVAPGGARTPFPFPYAGAEIKCH